MLADILVSLKFGVLVVYLTLFPLSLIVNHESLKQLSFSLGHLQIISLNHNIFKATELSQNQSLRTAK